MSDLTEPYQDSAPNETRAVQEDEVSDDTYKDNDVSGEEGEKESGGVTILPAKISLEDEDAKRLEWVAKVDLSRVPARIQLEDLALKVAEIRTGQRPLPTLRDFIRANTEFNVLQKQQLVATSLEGLLATHILLPDGSINQRKGLPMILAKDLNRVLAMTSPEIVSEAVAQMPSVEKGLLCSSLSVAMKEKIGIPDLEFCDPGDAAQYLENAMYDALGPAREMRIMAQRRSVEDALDSEPKDLTWQEQYHKRDTTMPVEVEDILTVIMERDGREGGFAQQVIDSLFERNLQKGKSQSSEVRAGILNNLLVGLIDYCEDMDMLGELQEFFSSHPETSKYYRLISKRIGFDRRQPLEEYV